MRIRRQSGEIRFCDCGIDKNPEDEDKPEPWVGLAGSRGIDYGG